jgi:hypothetical protein
MDVFVFATFVSPVCLRLLGCRCPGELPCLRHQTSFSRTIGADLCPPACIRSVLHHSMESSRLPPRHPRRQQRHIVWQSPPTRLVRSISSDELRLRFESELIRRRPSRTPIVTKTLSAISSASRTQTVIGIRCRTIHHFLESVNAIGSHREWREFVDRIYGAAFTPSHPKLVHQPPVGAKRR